MKKYIIILLILCVASIVLWIWGLILSPFYTLMLFGILMLSLMTKGEKCFEAFGITLFSPTLLLQLLTIYNAEKGSFIRLILTVTYIGVAIGYLFWLDNKSVPLMVTSYLVITVLVTLKILTPTFLVRFDKL